MTHDRNIREYTNKYAMYHSINFDTCSPYATPSATLQLKDASRLYVPAHLLTKSHKISSLYREDVYYLDVSHDVGHVLVHYLFTDTYQCLQSRGSSRNEKLIAEFTTSIHVYIAAREYGLSPLEELAKAEIMRLGDGFRIPEVFEIIQEAYPNPSTDDIWFCDYLKSRLNVLFINPKELIGWDLTAGAKLTTIGEILFRKLLELLQENIISSRNTAIEVLGIAYQDVSCADPGIESVADPAKLNGSTNDPILTTELNGDAEPTRSDSETKKSEDTTNKSDHEIARNGILNSVPKIESFGPETSKGDILMNEIEQDIKGMEDKKNGNDFWGLGLKKKKKKKATKGLVPEPLQEGVTVKI